MSLNVIMLLICLLLSGFFSSAETALFSISRAKALHLSKDGGSLNSLIYKMKNDSHKLLSTILIGNHFVNIGASSLATALAIDFFSSNAVGIATGVMTLLILIFGEVIPKSFAAHNNILVAKIAIFPLWWLSKIFAPLIIILKFVSNLLGQTHTSPSVTEDELMTMVEVVEEEGEIKEEEREFISNIFEFDDTSASEIMTPRADMYVVDINAPLNIRTILKSGFTRIPVIDGSIDNIVGILNVKDLFAWFHENCSDDATPVPIDISEIIREAYFVPESKKLDSLLHDFKQRKNHIGIVVDEHGGVCGIVTMEDVLEEIVGEIADETDHIDPMTVKLNDGKWIVLGKIEIDELNKKMGLTIPESTDYDTFSGYILDQMGRIPKVGETVQIDNYSVTVKERDGNRIKTFLFKQ
ncbi:MAG: HlyC/CorC family transporter [Desulfamplus sp.]|nr:HlyC/CorC family transporter [Desulfamplus sp.]